MGPILSGLKNETILLKIGPANTLHIAPKLGTIQFFVLNFIQAIGFSQALKF
jgi:hypothetical protein